MMQEPSHRELSFRANSFARFAKRYGITVEVQPVDPLGLVDNASLKESKYFLAAVHKNERIYSFTAIFDDYLTALPSTEDILEYLANQAAVYEKVGDDAVAFARWIKQPVEVARAYLEDIRFSVPPFKQFLGPMAYTDFIQITEPRGRLQG
jgi:hypothetical protein